MGGTSPAAGPESNVRGVGAMILVTVSTGHFDPLIQACVDLAKKYEFVGQIGIGTVVPPFKHFRKVSPVEIEDWMRRSELVISHAGTGMLSTLYRLRKASVVVPKQVRYGESNNGQVELAVKWAELKMGVLCMDVAQLEGAIQTCRRTPFHFPAFQALGRNLEAEIRKAEKRTPETGKRSFG